MDFKKDSFLAYSEDYKLELRAKKFKQQIEFDEVSEFVHTGDWITGVRLTIWGKGNLRNDSGYVMFSIKNFGARYRHTLTCSCILSLLDVEGERKVPRRFDFIFSAERDKYQRYSEIYVKRSFILNNASEYLPGDTLTVIVEGTLEEWVESNGILSPYTLPHSYDSTFTISESPDLKVYLRKHSIHAKFLIEYSAVFRDMWNTPLRESLEECVLLKNEELPAFLNMLVFLDTKMLVLYNVTMYDVYKIADKYHILILLNKCRENIVKFLSDTMSFNLNFMKQYDIKYNSERNIERYFQKTQVVNSNFETGNSLDDHPVLDEKFPFDRSIRTREEFIEYLENIGKEMENISEKYFLTPFFTSEKKSSFEMEMNGEFLGLYLRKDSVHAKFLIEYSGIFRKFWSSPMPDSSEKLFRVNKEELREFICMLLFIQSKRLILVDVTVLDMYKIANKYDVPILHEECKKHIRNMMLITVSDILNFARYYNDIELGRLAVAYLEANSLDTQDDNPAFEFGGKMYEYHVCDTFPVASNLIQSASDFWQFMAKISKSVQGSPEVDILNTDTPAKKCNTETESESFDFYK